MPASREDVVSMDLILTAGCNLTCAYCYENAKTADRRMSVETLETAIDLLLQSRRRDLLLTFYGGEPLLEFPLIRHGVQYVKSRPCRPGRRLRFATVTNGTLLDDEKAAFLARHRFITQLSFDGVRKSQDVRGRGTFDRLDALLDRLAARYPRWFKKDLRVNITITSATVRYLADSVAYFLAKGVRDIRMGSVSTHDWGWKKEMIGTLDRQFARIRRLSLSHWQRAHEVPVDLFRQGSPSVHAPQQRSMCGVGRGEALSVDVDGEVHGCVKFVSSYQQFPSFLAERFDSMRMGAVGNPGFSEKLALYPDAARKAGIFDEKQDKYSSYGRCGECRYLKTCNICPVSIGQIPGNQDPRRVPDFACAFNLVSNRHAELLREGMAASPAVFHGLFEIPASMRALAAGKNR